MITITDITVNTTVDGEVYEFDVALVYTGTRSSVYGEMSQYYMKTSGSVAIPISGQTLLTSVSFNDLTNSNDGFFRFVFIQGEVYDVAGTYATGDVIYNVSQSRFEKCTTAIGTPKAYDSADWSTLSPEDSDINASFKSVKDVLMYERAKKTLLDLREQAITEFIDGGCTTCDNSKNTKLRRVDSLVQAADDNFNDLDNKTLAQKYIEYIDIVSS